MWCYCTSYIRFIGGVAKCANTIAYPYLSVHGTSYSDSVVESFKILTDSGYEKVASLAGVGFLTFVMFLIYIISSFSFNYFFYLNAISLTDADTNLVISIIATLVFCYVFVGVFKMLESAVMALIYTSITMPDQTKEFVDILNDKKTKMDA